MPSPDYAELSGRTTSKLRDSGTRTSDSFMRQNPNLEMISWCPEKTWTFIARFICSPQQAAKESRFAA